MPVIQRWSKFLTGIGLGPTAQIRIMLPLLVLCFSLLLPSSASAYVGPGVGISLLSALWAVIMAILLALGGLLAWPLRALLRRRKAVSAKSDDSAPGDSGPEKNK